LFCFWSGCCYFFIAMVFSEEQRLLLFTGWKHGYLSDNENYGKFSEMTGLSRKQISNWARAQIKKMGDEPIPQQSDTPLGFIIEDLYRKKRVKRKRVPEDISASSNPGIAPSHTAKEKRPRIRYSEYQRTVLQISWERGFLCDNKHYGTISEISGLNRKQISNWARARMNKCGNDCLPPNNPAPIKTIFKELLNWIHSHPESNITHNIQLGPQHSNCNDGQIKRDAGMWLSAASAQPYWQSSVINTNGFANSKCLPPPCMPFSSCRANERTLNNGGQSRCRFPNNFTPQPPKSFETCSRNSIFEWFGRKKTDLPINRFFLKLAVQGSNVLCDRKVDVLAKLLGIKEDEIRFWLVGNGWRARASVQGLQYERIVRADGSCNSIFKS